MKIVFVNHPGDCRDFLFETPVDIKSGEFLSVNTMSGVAFATAVAPSMDIADSSVEDFAKYHKAYTPLKKVVGRYELKQLDEKPAQKFKVGDKVRCIKHNCYAPVGTTGEVWRIDNSSYPFGIRWDDAVDGNSLIIGDRQCENGHGEWVEAEHIELIQQNNENPAVREVGRKAKVGEYIKIVDGSFVRNPLAAKIGQIVHCERDTHLVNDVGEDGFVWGIGASPMNDDENTSIKYVVLEGYTDEMYRAYLADEAK